MDDLSALRDIHLPSPIGFWPLAIGWYPLVCLVLIMLLLAIKWSTQRLRLHLFHREALRMLEECRMITEKNPAEGLALLSIIMKRIAKTTQPDTFTPSSINDEWINFLEKTGKGLDFSSVRTLLCHDVYRPDPQGNYDKLFFLCRQWITRQRPHDSI